MDSFTSHPGILPQVLGMAHSTSTELEETLQLPACSRAVLAGPVGAVCLAFVFTVGRKVGKEEQSMNIPTRIALSTSLTVSYFHSFKQ